MMPDEKSSQASAMLKRLDLDDAYSETMNETVLKEFLPSLLKTLNDQDDEKELPQNFSNRIMQQFLQTYKKLKTEIG